MLKTIKSKFIFFTTLFIVASVGIPTAFLMYQYRQNFHQRSQAMIETTMEVIHNGLYHAMLVGKQDEVQNIITNLALHESIEHIRIFNQQGKIVHASHGDEINKNIKDIAPHHIRDISSKGTIISMLEEKEVYSAARPIINEPACQKCHESSQKILAYIDVDTNLTRAEINFYTGSVHIIFLALAVISLLAFGFYILFNKFINTPVAQFTHALDLVRQGNLNIKLPADNEDEIGILQGHFNHMVKNLRRSKSKIEELHFEQLQRADKLVTLGELAAEMAHEINNPAGIIMSRADYLQMRLGDQEKYKEDIDVILRQIEKVSSITGNILKYSKKLPKNYSPVNIAESMDESLHILDPRIRKKNIQIVKKVENKSSLIYADQVQIEQVFTNLISNSIDAMEKNGHLEINIKNSSNFLEVRISDDGCGIKQVDLDKIFTPFYTTKSVNQGTGLGLYIVRNILKNHGAQIQCDSMSGQGTRFTINFPVKSDAGKV